MGINQVDKVADAKMALSQAIEAERNAGRLVLECQKAVLRAEDEVDHTALLYSKGLYSEEFNGVSYIRVSAVMPYLTFSQKPQ